MKLNNAQRLYARFTGVDRDWWSADTAQVAVEQVREWVSYKKAPHAYRGSLPRPRHEKVNRYVMSKAHGGMIPVRRPFKGHRA